MHSGLTGENGPRAQRQEVEGDVTAADDADALHGGVVTRMAIRPTLIQRRKFRGGDAGPRWA